MAEIAEGISLIDVVRGANVYLISTEDGSILVDSGLPGSREALLRYLEERGVDGPKYLVLTHADMDHVGNAAAIKRATGAMIAIGAEDAPALAGETGLLRKLVNRAMRVDYLEADLVLKDGDRVGGFQVIAVPGHTAGSLALWRPRDRVLVSGDALLADGRGNERGPRKMMAYDYALALRSAAVLRQLDYKLLLPGHGRPRMSTTNDPGARESPAKSTVVFRSPS